jgi:Tol biopolymer transport system component
VLDEASDLIIYDVEKNEVTPICNTPDLFETFPTWNKTGDTLFYCVAKPEITRTGSDSTGWKRAIARFDSVYYDLMALPYDLQTNTFGAPAVLFPASQIQRSITLPRVSPNGRYLLFTLGDFGQFHIWHKSSDLPTVRRWRAITPGRPIVDGSYLAADGMMVRIPVLISPISMKKGVKRNRSSCRWRIPRNISCG